MDKHFKSSSTQAYVLFYHISNKFNIRYFRKISQCKILQEPFHWSSVGPGGSACRHDEIIAASVMLDKSNKKMRFEDPH